MAEDRTPTGDAMTHRFPLQMIPERSPKKQAQPDVPAPDNVPPTGSPEDKPNQKPGDDDKPKAPDPEDEPCRRYIPIDLPGREHAPERV